MSTLNFKKIVLSDWGQYRGPQTKIFTGTVKGYSKRNDGKQHCAYPWGNISAQSFLGPLLLVRWATCWLGFRALVVPWGGCCHPPPLPARIPRGVTSPQASCPLSATPGRPRSSWIAGAAASSSGRYWTAVCALWRKQGTVCSQAPCRPQKITAPNLWELEAVRCLLFPTAHCLKSWLKYRTNLQNIPKIISNRYRPILRKLENDPKIKRSLKMYELFDSFKH